MSIILVSTPDKTVNGLDSNVNAAISQLPYEFRREDYPGAYGANLDISGVYMRLDISLGNITNQFTEGDIIYLLAPGYNLLAVLNEAVWSGTQVRLAFYDVPFVGNTPGFVNNITGRPNYKLVIEILDDNELSDNALIDFNFRYAAEQNGRIFIDVAQILTDYLKFAELVSQEYRLQYWETWTGVESKGIETAVSAVVNAGGFCNVATTPEPWQVGQQIVLDSTAVYPNVPGVITSIEVGGFICDIAFISITASGFVRTLNSFDITAIIQAIAARKQQGLQGGSNLWEHLLRIGGTTIPNINYKAQGVPSEYDAGNDNWDTLTPDEIIGFLNPSLSVLNPLIWNDEEKSAIIGTPATHNITLTYIITDFLAAGNLRIDFVGIRANGTTAIWNNLALVINGNSENISVQFSNTVDCPVDNFVMIGWRANMTGDYSAQVRVRLSDGENIQWTSYPQAKLLTKFKEPLI